MGDIGVQTFGKKIQRGYIYVIKTEGREFYKIGYCSDVRKRFSQIGGSCPDRLIIVMVSGLRPAPRSVEKRVHQTFHHRRHKGEWFKDLTEEELSRLERMLSPTLKSFQNRRVW